MYLYGFRLFFSKLLLFFLVLPLYTSIFTAESHTVESNRTNRKTNSLFYVNCSLSISAHRNCLRKKRSDPVSSSSSSHFSRKSLSNYPWDFSIYNENAESVGSSNSGYAEAASQYASNDLEYVLQGRYNPSNYIQAHFHGSSNHPHQLIANSSPVTSSSSSSSSAAASSNHGPLALISNGGQLGAAIHQLAHHSQPFQTNRLDFQPTGLSYGPIGGPSGGQPSVFLVSSKQQSFGNWFVPVLMMMVLPFITGAAFIPLFLKSIVYLLQIGRNLGILFPLIPPVLNGTSIG